MYIMFIRMCIDFETSTTDLYIISIIRRIKHEITAIGLLLFLNTVNYFLLIYIGSQKFVFLLPLILWCFSSFLSSVDVIRSMKNNRLTKSTFPRSMASFGTRIKGYLCGLLNLDKIYLFVCYILQTYNFFSKTRDL